MNTIAGFVSLCALSVSACLPFSARGQVSAESPTLLGDEWVPVDPARLADMRGGLLMPSGLSLSFGIERLVYVNGQLVASATLQIPDLGRMTADQASALAAINEGRVVQIGEGNRIGPGAGGNALVIQNTLDGQDISALTTLNVGVDTLGMLQELNSYDALHNALITSPGSP
ncbi:hypothetical protein [Pseudoxanthomonas sacheonensis]|uniref:Uncharacterized protein n=1 Tax=Pseudoxanthomonas sacheonensis TaxID=443615 RepID=A0ABU1RS85_9GAMM|nr:hypothetical protein [Pseudoxanthomonas sacheonensis]MDR6840755.1 hypothetical protein [Pseudoxanthomonas sacheonensis]